jgi:hypothetical protein
MVINIFVVMKFSALDNLFLRNEVSVCVCVCVCVFMGLFIMMPKNMVYLCVFLVMQSFCLS